jgi:hypothetical protein
VQISPIVHLKEPAMHRVRSFVLLAAVLVCAAAIIVRAESGFAGKWEGSTVTGRPVGLDLKVAGEQLTGKITLAQQTADITDGKVTAQTCTFRATVDERTVHFTGRLVNGEIELTVEGVQDPLLLKRAK